MQPFCVTKKDFIFCRNFIAKGSNSGGQKWMLCDTAGVGGGGAASPLHGFTLRASPAVKHSVSPLGTVGEYVEYTPWPLFRAS